ncbi:MAG: phosphatase PAP2 family protein [Pseudomonadota bacterium]
MTASAEKRRQWRIRMFGTVLARPILASLLLLGAVSALFWTAPGIDLAVTGLYYSPDDWFPGRTNEALVLLRRIGIDAARGITICVVLLVVIRILFWRGPAVLSGRSLAFLLSSAALGPGLIVNIFLKEVWGRPRPHMVELFGGDVPFVPVWQITDYCQGNCSFVSGEAASAFWLFAFVFLVPRDMRRALFAAVALFAGAVSLNRIAFGGHFVSDVLIAWCLTLVVILAMRVLFLRPAGTPDPYDAALVSIGRAVSAVFSTQSPSRG